jgi:hypothetical protein
MRRHAALIGLLALIAPSGALAQTDRQATQRGAAWLETVTIGSVGQQADAIVALAAAGRSRASLRPRLTRMSAAAFRYATTAGGAGKVVLATVAAGGNPRSLGGVDYIRRIENQYAAGRYGVTAYDQAFAMLALRAAGEPTPAAAVTALRAARGKGGWGFALRKASPDDVSATGLTIEALRAVGMSRADAALRGATAWLAAQINTRGGFGIDGRGQATEANSTAIAIRALRAMGRTPATATRRALRNLQEADGGFRFTAMVKESRLLATVDAVLALSGHRLPPPY